MVDISTLTIDIWPVLVTLAAFALYGLGWAIYKAFTGIQWVASDSLESWRPEPAQVFHFVGNDEDEPLIYHLRPPHPGDETLIKVSKKKLGGVTWQYAENQEPTELPKFLDDSAKHNAAYKAATAKFDLTG